MRFCFGAVISAAVMCFSGLAAGAQSGEVEVTARLCFDTELDNARAPRALPLGNGIMFSDWTRTLYTLSLEDGTATPVLEGLSDEVFNLSVSADESVVLVRFEDRSFQAHDLATGTLMSAMGPHRGYLRETIINADGSRAMSRDANLVGALWDVAAGTEIVTFVPPQNPVSAFAFSEDGTMAVVGVGNGVLYYDAGAGERLHSYEFAEIADHIVHVQFFDADHSILVFSRGEVRIINHSEGRLLRSWAAEPEFALVNVVASLNHAYLAYDDTSSVYVHNLATGEVLHRLDHEDSVQRLRMDATGARLVSAGQDATVRLWDSETGEELARFLAHEGVVSDARVLPGDDAVLSLGSDDQICVFDIPAQ
ncbi:WD40 repeat domain-containing protein [Gymnodinialimonas hymeniacidonis]|uniref:WD40 repeat domain-containing protein n=1 Tax=Gymnodinialimonas hymeniacidonis TaxID=3126508 RepID=UPI0034C6D01F